MLKYLDNCGDNKPRYHTMKDMWHLNQCDAIIQQPVVMYALMRKSLPQPDYVDFYIMNVWLGMKFLEDQGLCSYPEHQR